MILWILNHYWEFDDIKYKLCPIFVYNEYQRNAHILPRKIETMFSYTFAFLLGDLPNKWLHRWQSYTLSCLISVQHNLILFEKFFLPTHAFSFTQMKKKSHLHTRIFTNTNEKKVPTICLFATSRLLESLEYICTICTLHILVHILVLKVS